MIGVMVPDGTHGLTNLGGALLAILVVGTNSEREAIRYTIARLPDFIAQS
jgi:hypothetical protein